MSDKRLTVILLRVRPRHLARRSRRLANLDMFAAGGPRPLYEGRSEEATIDLRLQLPFDAGQVYGFTFSAPDHRPAWQLVRRADFIRAAEQVEVDDVILRLMLMPDSPGTTDLPNAFERIRQIGSPFAPPASGITAEAFDALAEPAKMAFLNIEAKLRETSIDGSPLMSFVRGVSHVAVDRVFLRFEPGLKARMARATEFAKRPWSRGTQAFPDIPDHPDSWKHVRFAEGQYSALVLEGCGASGGSIGPGTLGRRRHRPRARIGARKRVARKQRVPAGPQDEPGARLRAALRAGHPAALHARSRAFDHAACGADPHAEAGVIEGHAAHPRAAAAARRPPRRSAGAPVKRKKSVS